ncbi:MAG: hypothetical protein Q7S73_00070 [bacterium]|nr:hypothetical protein [bacterium]
MTQSKGQPDLDCIKKAFLPTKSRYLVSYKVEIHPYPDTKIEERELRFEEEMTLDEANEESSRKKEELSKFSKIKSWKLFRLEEIKTKPG